MTSAAFEYSDILTGRELSTPIGAGAAWRPCVAGVALLFLTVLAYVPLNRAGFIWDDDYYVYKNVFLRSARGLWEMWMHPFQPRTPQYYPFTFTTFWIEYHLWGLKPRGFHIDNVVLHSLSAIVLWRLLKKLSVPGAWLAAAVFALHPVHVESVAWVSERKNVLSGLLFLLALTAYLRWIGLTEPAESQSNNPPRVLFAPSRRWYALALALFVLAVLSKTVTSSLPAVVLLIVYWKRGRVSWRDVRPLTPFFAFGGALGLLTSWLERHVVGAEGPVWQFSFLQRALIASRALWFYALKLIWPTQLTFIYPRWEIDTHNPVLYVFLVAALAVPIGLWLLRGRLGRGPLVAVLLFGGCLFPALGFANIYPMRFSFVADHFQYLASIGLIVLGVGTAVRLLHRIAPRQPGIVGVLGAGVIVMLLFSTFIRTGVFRSPKLLWTDATDKNPKAWMAYQRLATVLIEAKDYVGARKALDSAQAVEPDYAYSRLNRVILDIISSRDPLAKIKPDPADAIREARLALADVAGDTSYLGRSEQSACWKLLAAVYFAQRDQTAAQDAFQHVVSLNPYDMEARRDLARVLEHRKDLGGALEQWSQIIRLAPANAQAHAHSALLEAQIGRPDDAAKELVLAQSLDARYATYTLKTPLRP